jgi:hypothetical protein
MKSALALTTSLAALAAATPDPRVTPRAQLEEKRQDADPALLGWLSGAEGRKRIYPFYSPIHQSPPPLTSRHQSPPSAPATSPRPSRHRAPSRNAAPPTPRASSGPAATQAPSSRSRRRCAATRGTATRRCSCPRRAGVKGWIISAAGRRSSARPSLRL